MILAGSPVSAQFGQNKVQYQDFTWKYVSTSHFDVYYNEGLLPVAEFCAAKAEEALAGLTRNLSYRVPKRVNIVVYGSHNEFQQTNVLSTFLPEGVGGVTELFKNRVGVPFEGDWERFRHVIHHELVHAYLNEMLYSGSIKYALQTRVQLPLWMNEGLAEFESLDGMDDATDMFMRDITLNETLPSLEELSNFFAYRGGQAFYAYVAETYGRGKIGELIARVRAGGDVNSVFRSAFGMDVEQFSEKWQEDMKKLYYPDLEKFKRLDDFAKRLTNHVKEDTYYNSSPAISPDGSKMAFISYRDGEYGIYVVDIERKAEPTRLVSSQRTLNFEELNVLTPGISWNPKGDKIAITAKAGGEDALFIVDVRSGAYEKFVNDMRSMTSAAWSPDGASIAIVATVKEKCDIHLFSVKERRFRKLTDDPFTDAAPAWSLNSASVYFISDRDTSVAARAVDNRELRSRDIRGRDIYRVDVQTGAVTRITEDPGNVKTSLAVA
ncbi:MAG: peptidase MA family metallohydrolase, partial [Candidatus Kapaibacterium sp.]